MKKKLNANRVSLGDRIHGQSPGVLAGLLRCSACDSMMTHSTSGGSGRGSKRYRYYVCNKATKRGHKTCPRPSLPAEEVERFVVAQLQTLTIDETLLNDTINLTNLAPDIQQEILDLEPTTDHVPRFHEREVRTIATLPNWESQRMLWKRLVKRIS